MAAFPSRLTVQLTLFDITPDMPGPGDILPMTLAQAEPPRRKLQPGERVMHAATYRMDAKEYIVEGYDQRGGLILRNPRTGKVTNIPERGVAAFERDAAGLPVR
jgi:hypothetical protein